MTKVKTRTELSAWVSGIGIIAPGINNWQETQNILCGKTNYSRINTILPIAEMLPPAERRRASRAVKLVMAVGLEAANQANQDASELTTVFASSNADGHNCHALCEQLASDDRQISPTRFHNSVQNAPAGYWSIATGAMQSAQVVCAFDASFGAGLLDALSQVILEQCPVLLIAYDSEYPEPIFSKRDVPDAAGIALLLEPSLSDKSIAQITVNSSQAVADKMTNVALEKLRLKIPALRALPLLSLLANFNDEATPKNQQVVLDYLEPMRLEVIVNKA